jgi:hypothetical protein
MIYRILIVTMILISLGIVPRISAQEKFCNCTFAVHPDQETYPCRVFGQLGDGELIPWNRANQTCLDDLAVNNSTIDADRMFAMCPYPNSTDASVELIFAEIRSNLENPDNSDMRTNNTAIKAIQARYPRFWVENSTLPGSFVLAETIYDSRDSPVQCSTSVNLCWGVVKDYFTAKSEELGTLCRDFYFWYAYEQVLEQSTARRFLCENSGTNVTSKCGPLASQVLDIKELKPGIECNAYENGPGDISIPIVTCKASTTPNSSPSTSSSSQSLWNLGIAAMVAAASALLL